MISLLYWIFIYSVDVSSAKTPPFLLGFLISGSGWGMTLVSGFITGGLWFDLSIKEGILGFLELQISDLLYLIFVISIFTGIAMLITFIFMITKMKDLLITNSLLIQSAFFYLSQIGLFSIFSETQIK